MDIQPSTHGTLRELACFAGIGGGILGGQLLGWKTVCAIERDAYGASVLAQRQNDGFLEPFPIFSDVETFDGRPWRGSIDMVSGGFPCTGISIAGEGLGLDDEQSGLWREMRRIIGEVRPRYAFLENSPALTVRGLGTVLGDLSKLGYDTQWGVMGADIIGAPHKRDRIWIVVSDTNVPGLQGSLQQQGIDTEGWEKSCYRPATQRGLKWVGIGRGGWYATEPSVGRVDNGIPHRVDRIKAFGNAQVPAVVATAYEILK